MNKSIRIRRIKLDDPEYWSGINGILVDDLSINDQGEDEAVLTVEPLTGLGELLRMTTLVLLPTVFLVSTSVAFLIHQYYLASCFAALLALACILGFTSRQYVSIKKSAGVLTKSTVWLFFIHFTTEEDIQKYDSLMFHYAKRGSKITATLKAVGDNSSRKLLVLASYDGLAKIEALCEHLSGWLDLKNAGGRKAVFRL